MASVHAADTSDLVVRSASKGYQWLSLLTPPAYSALILARRGKGGWSIRRFLRATWLGGLTGIIIGGSFEYVRSAYSNEETVRLRRLQTAHNTASLRSEFHSRIGMVTFAVLTPAIAWRRALPIDLILGGAGIGSGIGVLAHHARTMLGDPPPEGEIPSPAKVLRARHRESDTS